MTPITVLLKTLMSTFTLTVLAVGLLTVIVFHVYVLPAVVLALLLGFGLGFKWALHGAALAIVKGKIKLP